MATFIESVRSGSSSISDIDQWIECWHTSDDKAISGLPLHEYLGFTQEEYQEFMHDPSAVERFVSTGSSAGRPSI